MFHLAASMRGVLSWLCIALTSSPSKTRGWVKLYSKYTILYTPVQIWIIFYTTSLPCRGSHLHFLYPLWLLQYHMILVYWWTSCTVAFPWRINVSYKNKISNQIFLFHIWCYRNGTLNARSDKNKDKLSICCNFFEIYIPLARLYIYIFI